ncbi:hypothetical protein VNO78_06315 [Psophocarpus tetragonolobus]|uniref:S-locus glycoprotein domain-containing protein n=1 Tax=Psophocarpus tetragonolobus TaxID=3891 RepID=A0AAN9SUV5_PSOTE
MGWDLRTGLERKITSWKGLDNPSPGQLSWGLMLHNYPEFYLMIGKQKYFRIGPWNGLHFSGLSNQNPNPVYAFEYVTTNDLMYASNKVEMFYSFTLKNSSVFAQVKINETTSSIQTTVWEKDWETWRLYQVAPRDSCDEKLGLRQSVKIVVAATIAGITGILSVCIFAIYRVRRSISVKAFTLPGTVMLSLDRAEETWLSCLFVRSIKINQEEQPGHRQSVKIVVAATVCISAIESEEAFLLKY